MKHWCEECAGKIKDAYDRKYGSGNWQYKNGETCIYNDMSTTFFPPSLKISVQVVGKSGKPLKKTEYLPITYCPYCGIEI